MSNKSESGFSAREMRYLQSLPAVERVTQNRIHYTDEFKRDVVRRYNAGESPVQIFRRAGLDTSLIGYKRIERCLSRWRKTNDDKSEDVDGKTFDIPKEERWSGAYTPPVGDQRYRGEREVININEIDSYSTRLIISQQARRIDELEHQVEHLEQYLRERGIDPDVP